MRWGITRDVHRFEKEEEIDFYYMSMVEKGASQEYLQLIEGMRAFFQEGISKGIEAKIREDNVLLLVKELEDVSTFDEFKTWAFSTLSLCRLVLWDDLCEHLFDKINRDKVSSRTYNWADGLFLFATCKSHKNFFNYVCYDV